MAVQDLSPKEFLAAYNNTTGEKELIDVRNPHEIEEISIEGHVAINIQHPSFVEKINALDKNKTYFVYCRSGNRSGQACKYMASQGFENLYNMKGGMLEYVETDFDD
ncbi:MAG TPA: rhodanese-like domain-containing protein [Chitinophagales bacterium]|nr:rhodanese-like domain-containing protein [Chitinophagales bacterium]MCB0511078.1 rhodanese-like domain-containing protein [Bacteroidota bacterium]HMU97379.1 rhodanese-like domain-containing protein [Chitinophagales bacterium]HMV02081.1 rhodanese-like domain-containing protein [Chitinophagales bacterium]HMW93969.1 rhodanese-like domain-containing protein [Chitinophagales bacterium]